MTEEKTPKMGAKAGRRLDEIEKEFSKSVRSETEKKATDLATADGDRMIRLKHVQKAEGREPASADKDSGKDEPANPSAGSSSSSDTGS